MIRKMTPAGSPGCVDCSAPIPGCLSIYITQPIGHASIGYAWLCPACVAKYPGPQVIRDYVDAVARRVASDAEVDDR